MPSQRNPSISMQSRDGYDKQKQSAVPKPACNKTSAARCCSQVADPLRICVFETNVALLLHACTVTQNRDAMKGDTGICSKLEVLSIQWHTWHAIASCSQYSTGNFWNPAKQKAQGKGPMKKWGATENFSSPHGPCYVLCCVVLPIRLSVCLWQAVLVPAPLCVRALY